MGPDTLLRRQVNLADPALPQPPGDDLGRRLCAEPLELVESTSKGAVIVRVGKREGGFVGAADLRPQLRCARPVAGDLDRVRLGRPIRRLVVESGAPAPARELSDRPRDPLPERVLEGVLRRYADAIRGSSSVGAASASASSRGDCASGSPRRARTRPSTTSAWMRGNVEM